MRGYYLFAYTNPGGFNPPVSSVCCCVSDGALKPTTWALW